MEEESNNKLRDMLKKWESVEDFQELAVHLFNVSKGDVRKLVGKYKENDGVYGKVCEILFDENDELHRYLLWNIWTSNKGDIRVRP